MSFLDKIVNLIRQDVEKYQEELQLEMESMKTKISAEQLRLPARIEVLSADLDKLRHESSMLLRVKKTERDASMDLILEKLGLEFEFEILPCFKKDKNGYIEKFGIQTSTSIKDSSSNVLFSSQKDEYLSHCKNYFEQDYIIKQKIKRFDRHDYIADNFLKEGSLSWFVDEFYPTALRERLMKVNKILEEDYFSENYESLQLKHTEIEKSIEDYQQQLEKQKKILIKLESKSKRNKVAKRKYENQFALFRNLENKKISAGKEEKFFLQGIKKFHEKDNLEKEIKNMKEISSTPEFKNLISQFETKQQKFEDVVKENKLAMETADTIERKIKILKRKNDELLQEIDAIESYIKWDVEDKIDELVSQEAKKLLDDGITKEDFISAVLNNVDLKLDDIDEKIINGLSNEMGFNKDNEFCME